MSGGLGRLFSRIIPLIMLICFICFGISKAIVTPNTENLTYLTEEYYDTTTYEKIQNPTEEQKLNADKVYNFNMAKYIQNIDINILTRAFQKVVNLEEYTKSAQNIEEIWKDGYQPLEFDILKTILNAIILALNTTILIINIILYPIRIIAGILLTTLSIIGINISQGYIIIPFFKFILDKFALPFIQDIQEKNEYITSDIIYTTWYIDSAPIINDEYGVILNGISFNFTATNKYGNDVYFEGIRVYKTGNIFARKNVVAYLSNGNEYIVYKGGWIEESMRTITIEPTNFGDGEEDALRTFLGTHCTQIT